MIWLGIVLFVVGLGALVASVVVDRRAASQIAPVEAAWATGDMSADAEAEVPSSEPELITSDISPAAAEEAAAAAEVARARLAELRAELLRTAPRPAEPEPQEAPARETTAQEAERVFAAVAAVGRPTPEPESATAEEPVPEAEDAKPEAAAVAVEPLPQPESSEPEVSTDEVPPEDAEHAEHAHEDPIANHGDLVAHLRSQHPEVEEGGSTIQMRALHEQAHAPSADT